MVIVGRDWYNSSTVMGNSIGVINCGGFNIAGNSLNSGTIGTPNVRVDICDAGHPVSGIDANVGTIATTTTYCTCSNNCNVVAVGLDNILSDELAVSVFPNPTNTNVLFKFNYSHQDNIKIELNDMLGKKLIVMPVNTIAGDNVCSIDISSLPQGLFVASIIFEDKILTKKIINVMH